LLDEQFALGVKAARAARRTAQRELVGKPGDLLDVNGVAAFGAADRAADIDGAFPGGCSVHWLLIAFDFNLRQRLSTPR
jgi:hypothetical protein